MFFSSVFTLPEGYTICLFEHTDRDTIVLAMSWLARIDIFDGDKSWS